MKDNAPKLGQVISNEAFRDAIHIAVASVKVGAPKLYPGDHVGLLSDGSVSTSAKPHIGIIDPYLTNPIYADEQVWLLMYPNTITGLRHEWTHPAFESLAKPDVEPLGEKEHAEAVLRQVASRCGVSYERFIAAIEADDYINMGDNEEYNNVLSEYDTEELCKYASLITGTKVDSVYVFSCSC